MEESNAPARTNGIDSRNIPLKIFLKVRAASEFNSVRPEGASMITLTRKKENGISMAIYLGKVEWVFITDLLG
ncbi:hypothetical protein D3C85_1408960 [compost metagenome]